MTRSRRVLIFDLDGTLVDSMRPYSDLFCEMLELECGVPDGVSRPVYTRLMGKGPRAQFDAVLRQVETWNHDRVEDLTKRYWLRAEVHEPALFPEVSEVLEGLHQDGHTLVVSSGSIPRSVERKLRLTGIARLFRFALGSDEHLPAMAKGPGDFSLITEGLAMTRDELREQGVFIGDGIYDMEIARTAGMTAIGRLTDDNAARLRRAGAHHVITDLSGLPPLVDSL
jgi:phosphoglycolate phosphatase-like HAD superfamily hydrolase